MEAKVSLPGAGGTFSSSGVPRANGSPYWMRFQKRGCSLLLLCCRGLLEGVAKIQSSGEPLSTH